MNNDFQKFNLSDDLFKAITSLGFTTATPIQEQAIPEVIAGHDIIGLASTGTGKTAAFAIPAIEKVDLKIRAAQTLVLCPTRELAMQVAVEINKLLKFKRNVSALAIYGGQPISRQIFGLRRNPQIIIGTPGRTLDHIKRGTLQLGQVKLMVLDEADEMLDMGFRQDIEQILQAVRPDRQTVLFSATMSAGIFQLTKRYQKAPKMIKVTSTKLSAASVEQIYFDVEPSRKTDVLMQLIDTYKPRLAIVFCNTKRRVDEVARSLCSQGYSAAGIHGDIRQSKRDTIMTKFRNDRINVLVATGVAARGIDVANVEIVFNYEIPREVESYVHRIGRTGRAGKTGKALSLVSRREFGQLREIRRYTNVNIIQNNLPLNASGPDSRKDTTKCLLEDRASKVFNQIEQRMTRDELVKYSRIIEKFAGDSHSSTDVAAALLKMVIKS